MHAANHPISDLATAAAARTATREPRIEQPTDAIVPLTASAIFSTDLHCVRRSLSRT